MPRAWRARAPTSRELVAADVVDDVEKEVVSKLDVVDPAMKQLIQSCKDTLLRQHAFQANSRTL